MEPGTDRDQPVVASASSHPVVFPHLQLDELLAELQSRMQVILATRDRIRSLLEAVVAVGSGLDLETTLQRIVEAAVGLVDAQYGALGVIGEGQRLTEFVPVGLDQAAVSKIDHWPEGRGLLGLLIQDPRPLRLADIASHPESSGFPAGHPPMKSFLGVPVRVRNEVFGNLYLTGKKGGGEFTEDDEAVLIALGAAAAVAIDHARLYDAARSQQRWMGANAEVATSLLSGADPDEVLASVTRQVRDLAGADLVALALPEQDDSILAIRFADGDGADSVRGLVLRVGRSLSGEVLNTGLPVTVDDFGQDARTADSVRGPMGHVGPAMLFPLGVAGDVRGVLTVGRRRGGMPFPEAIADVVGTFAAQAGIALELAARRSDAERLSLYEDRDRIARDLHDTVIQRLFALGLSLQGTARMVSRSDVATRIESGVVELDGVIRQLRSAIFDLETPPEDTGVRRAVLDLAQELGPVVGSTVRVTFDGPVDTAVEPRISEHLLASLREALTNVGKHADASTVSVAVSVEGNELSLEVVDDGVGFVESDGSDGHGLRNLRNRAQKFEGSLEVSVPEGGGTHLVWRVPC